MENNHGECFESSFNFFIIKSPIPPERFFQDSSLLYSKKFFSFNLDEMFLKKSWSGKKPEVKYPFFWKLSKYVWVSGLKLKWVKPVVLGNNPVKILAKLVPVWSAELIACVK